jgi:hypothetical protein
MTGRQNGESADFTQIDLTSQWEPEGVKWYSSYLRVVNSRICLTYLVNVSHIL